MNYNPNIHNRRSIRLKGYDYSQAGLYFITICVQDRMCLFGKIVGAENLPPLLAKVGSAVALLHATPRGTGVPPVGEGDMARMAMLRRPWHGRLARG